MHDRLHHFLLVVEAGTFTAAARRAHLSQPALSASIKALEEDLGARLLHRGRGGARPTDAGEALLPHARRALPAVSDGRRAVEEVAGLHVGEVRLGAGPTACTYLLPPTLAAFRREHPGVRYFLREAHAPAVWAGLESGELDLGVVSDASVPARPGWWTVERWRDDELLVVEGPDGADGDGWVSFGEGSSLRALLEEHLPGARVVMELQSIAAVKGNVRAGVGRALVPRAAMLRDLADGHLVPVEGFPSLTRSLVLIHRGADALPKAAARLREALLDQG
jgi:DNA-binding transcriptional LysR family regulator